MKNVQKIITALKGLAEKGKRPSISFSINAPYVCSVKTKTSVEDYEIEIREIIHATKIKTETNSKGKDVLLFCDYRPLTERGYTDAESRVVAVDDEDTENLLKLIQKRLTDLPVIKM